MERACRVGDYWAVVSEGTYILRTNIHDWSDEELWKTYVQLSEAGGSLPHSEV